jgi:lysophospholipase L1-like esterase
MRNWISFLAFSLLLLSAFCSSPPKGVVILCAGDSLTDSEYPRDLRRLLARDGYRAQVLNYGRKGDTSGEYLRFLERQKEALGRRHPDFVLLQLGTNDVRLDGDMTDTPSFARNMRRIIAFCRGFVTRGGDPPRILLATIPPVPETVGDPFGPRSRERIAREINPFIETLAREEQLALVDNYSLFLREPGLLPGVHPSREGYRRLAENWYRALHPWLRQYPPPPSPKNHCEFQKNSENS